MSELEDLREKLLQVRAILEDSLPLDIEHNISLHAAQLPALYRHIIERAEMAIALAKTDDEVRFVSDLLERPISEAEPEVQRVKAIFAAGELAYEYQTDHSCCYFCRRYQDDGGDNHDQECPFALINPTA